MDFPAQVLERVMVKRGTILYSESLFPDIDHGKFFIIIGESETQYIGCFFVNSNAPRFMHGKQELLNLQYPLRYGDYPFLKYDSFVGCHEMRILEKKNVTFSLRTGGSEVKDVLQDTHITDILEMVRESKVFTTREKDTFFR